MDMNVHGSEKNKDKYKRLYIEWMSERLWHNAWTAGTVFLAIFTRNKRTVAAIVVQVLTHTPAAGFYSI